MARRTWKQGIFKPMNPSKYVGNINNIVYRSSWELQVMLDLDGSKDIKSWSSEPLAIPYLDKTTNVTRRYYPDFIVTKMDGSVWMIEIKPFKETNPPKPAKTKKGEARYLREALLYGKNCCKWEAAREFCRKRGWNFKIVSETYNK